MPAESSPREMAATGFARRFWKPVGPVPLGWACGAGRNVGFGARGSSGFPVQYLDVMAVGIQHECSEVSGAVVIAVAWLSVANAAARQRRKICFFDVALALGCKAKMKPSMAFQDIPRAGIP